MKLIQNNSLIHLIPSKNQKFLQLLNVSFLILTVFLSSQVAASIIGTDQRVSTKNIYFPSSAITKLHFTRAGKASFCTAPMIDSRIAVTNAHCLKDSKALLVQSGPYQAKVIKVITPTRQDFSFLILSNEIGYETGWFALADYNHTRFVNKQAIQLEGYSRDKGFYAQSQKCASRYLYRGGQVYGHDCDTAPGSSGAPLFVEQKGKAYLVGINRASSKKQQCSLYNHLECTNIAISGSVIKKAFIQLKSR